MDRSDREHRDTFQPGEMTIGDHAMPPRYLWWDCSPNDTDLVVRFTMMVKQFPNLNRGRRADKWDFLSDHFFFSGYCCDYDYESLAAADELLRDAFDVIIFSLFSFSQINGLLPRPFRLVVFRDAYYRIIHFFQISPKINLFRFFVLFSISFDF